ncbi:hypothetical protein CRUP_037884 [Coryphaenoides rupestris]|nr:hypothetical protein CRUP_037884 [Coryphaenoides rupestris]
MKAPILGTIARDFGEVCRGCVKLPSKRDLPVAIKTLRAGCSDKQRRAFLSEAGVLGQFDHANVIRLEGVITTGTREEGGGTGGEGGEEGGEEQGGSEVVVEEEVKKHEGQLTAMQLVDMLSGVASGMKYLTDMGFIHRRLAAHKVLVNANLGCKVSGFRPLQDDKIDAIYTTLVSERCDWTKVNESQGRGSHVSRRLNEVDTAASMTFDPP